MKMESKYFDSDGVKLHYVQAGDHAKTIVFLHGFPEFWYMWKAQLQNFSEDFRAVALDMRGYNLSDKPPEVENYAIEILIQDISNLIEHLGEKNVTLVAHDWGGAVAIATALKHPTQIEKLIILNAPHPLIFQRELANNPKQKEASAYMQMLSSEEAEVSLEKNDYEWLFYSTLSRSLRKGFINETDVQAYKKAWGQPGALTGMVNYYRASMVGPDKGNYFPNAPNYVVEVPSLIIWGEWDRALTLQNLDSIETYFKAGTVKRVPETTHWIVTEKPELVNGLIRDFVV